jgi:hypothetical protein
MLPAHLQVALGLLQQHPEVHESSIWLLRCVRLAAVTVAAAGSSGTHQLLLAERQRLLVHVIVVRRHALVRAQVVLVRGWAGFLAGSASCAVCAAGLVDAC